MSRATRFKIYRVLVIASIILIIPLLFIVGVTLPYLFNTIKVSFPEIAIGKDVERYIAEKELDFKNTDAKARKKIIWNCLLYTSPSPRDRTRSRMPSSA